MNTLIPHFYNKFKNFGIINDYGLEKGRWCLATYSVLYLHKNLDYHEFHH